MGCNCVLAQNSDGSISKDELKHVMNNVGENMSEAELEQMLYKADTNGSGDITEVGTHSSRTWGRPRVTTQFSCCRRHHARAVPVLGLGLGLVWREDNDEWSIRAGGVPPHDGALRP